MTKKTALVVAPGRGTYNKEDLGYFKRHHADKMALVEEFDRLRRTLGQKPIVDLDGAARFSNAEFSRGDNASGLIYACAYADFLAIDREKIDIVAVTGNSMGWYIALACGGAVSAQDGFRTVNTMGALMQEALIGGQMLYPFVDANWRMDEDRRAALFDLIDDIPGLHLSINLGGMIVFGGDEAALTAAEARLEPIDGRFPMRLKNHAAFHTELQRPISVQGQSALADLTMGQPTTPLVDGRGHVWYPFASDAQALWRYTLGHQVVEPYDFTAAIRSGVREFAPDMVIILGPGSTLGGAVAQSLIAEKWRGVDSKTTFQRRQAEDPIIASMGMDAQRKLVI